MSKVLNSSSFLLFAVGLMLFVAVKTFSAGSDLVSKMEQSQASYSEMIAQARGVR